jgi:hypothetical protein
MLQRPMQLQPQTHRKQNSCDIINVEPTFLFDPEHEQECHSHDAKRLLLRNGL